MKEQMDAVEALGSVEDRLKPALQTGEVTGEQVAQLERFVGAHEEGNRKGLPGPLLDVWTAPEIKAAGLTLQQPVASHIALLEAIGSPVWRAARATAEERGKITVSQGDVFEAIYLFTKPITECRSAFWKGREFFREAAWAAVGDRISPQLVDPLGLAVMENLARGFVTFIGYGAGGESSGEEESEGFSKPPIAPKMGSVGG